MQGLLNSGKSVMLTTQTQASFWNDCLMFINQVAPFEEYRDVKDGNGVHVDDIMN